MSRPPPTATGQSAHVSSGDAVPSREEALLRTQHTVACLLSDSGPTQEWARRVLQAIGEHLDWNYAALWGEDGASGRLRCEAVWHGSDPSLATFATASRGHSFVKDLGFLGRAWAAGRPALADLTTDSEFGRSAVAQSAGLQTGLAFPLQCGGQIVGLIELFSRERRQPDEGLMRVLGGLGAQLGLSIEGRRAAEALKQSEARFAMFMRHLPGAAWMKDLSGRYLYANAIGEKIFGASLQELRGKTDDDLFPPATATEFKNNDRLALNGDHEVQTIETLPQAEGPHHSIVRKFAIRDEDGNPVMIGGVAFDITDQLMAEKRERALSRLGHQLGEATTAEQAARTIVSVARDLFGWDACYLHLFSPTGTIVPVLMIDTMDGRLVDVPSTTLTLDPSPMMRRTLEQGAQLTLREPAGGPPDDLVPFGDKDHPSASLMHVPIRAGAGTVGVLSIQSYTPQAYRQEDLAMLQSLAEHCGGALERIQVAETLRKNEASQRAVLDALPDWLFRIRQDGAILDGKSRPNHQSAPLPFPQVAGPNLRDIWPETLVEQVLASVAKAISTATTQLFEFPHPDPAQRGEYEARVAQSGSDEALVIVRDVSEQARLEREILTISGQEQERIGRDLHDGLGQLLTGLGLLARALEGKLQACSPLEAADAAQLAQLAAHALSQARLAARGLFPVALETNGLLSALQELARNVERIFKISCSVEWNKPFAIENRKAQEHLYRLVQESVTNAVKHGQATQVRIRFVCEGPGLILTIQDNGSGIRDASQDVQGMGLRLMQYRARSLGAQLVICSEPSGGTAVRCAIPRISWSVSADELAPVHHSSAHVTHKAPQ